MPTVLSGRGKLSIAFFLLRCANSQDMTQSWPSQQALGGDQAQRNLFNLKDRKQTTTTHQRQGQGDAQLRMTRHPHVAPHKSMLADDLKLSSDEDDTQMATHESATWDGHSLSAQRTHTHGRRVRHSSSDSSGSNNTAESSSSSLHSQSSSPVAHPRSASPAKTQPLCSSKENDHPSAAQWQLDKWLKKSLKKSARSGHYPPRCIPERLPSPPYQRAPSPTSCWDSNQEYSPSQSPIPSPQFNYSIISPVPSPGYSFCPSPSPFPSTCPSPSASGRHSPIQSPVPSICHSPGGSPRASHSSSPIHIPSDPPRSPSPSFPKSRDCHYSDVQSQNQIKPSNLTTTPHRTKNRLWTNPSSNRGKPVNSTDPETPHQHRPKSKSTQQQDQNQNKPKVSRVLSSTDNHRRTSKPRSNSHPSSKRLTEASKAKQTPHFEQNQEGISKGSSNHKPQPPVRLSPTRTRLSDPACRETSAGQSSHTKSVSKTPSSSRCSPSLQLTAKSWEAKATNLAHVNQIKTSHKQRDVNPRGAHLAQAKGRKQEKKGDRYWDKQRKEQERKEDKRLAEEQLLRRPWIHSSAEEDEEEEEVGQTERQRRRETRERGENRRTQEQYHKHRWQTLKATLPTDTERHSLQEESHSNDKTKKGGRSEERQESRDPSPPSCISTPQRQSRSSSASSSSDSESEYQGHITRAAADSSYPKRFDNRGQQGPGRADANKPKVLPPRAQTSGNLIEGEQHSEGTQKLYTLVPFGRSDQTTASSQRGLRNLVVQIDLCLLRRVPDSAVKSAAKISSSSSASSSTKERQREAMKHMYMQTSVAREGKRKRKLENGAPHRESKKNIPYEKELPGHTTSSCLSAENNISIDTTHNGYLEEYLDSKRPLSPLSPLSDSPETTKPSSKTKNTEVHHMHTNKNRDKNRDSAVKPKMEMECVKVSKLSKPSSEPWDGAGQIRTMSKQDTPHHAEYYLHEAKRMKHRADAMVDKLGKAVNYVDAALSFMECGKAMEEGPLEAKSPYTMYSETVELIRYAMRLKSHSGPGAKQEDKQLAVLCFRCLALLYWQMFRLKKDHALKYSKVLLDYFKTSPKVPTMPSCWIDNEKDTGGLPSLLSPNAKHLRQSSHGGSASPSLISIPQRIHQMAANHLNITNSVLYSYEYWEVADNLASESKEFFNYLNTLSGPLTLHSSIGHAVQYTRQALQWIRISAKIN